MERIGNVYASINTCTYVSVKSMTIDILYSLTFEDGQTTDFELKFDDGTMALIADQEVSPPVWAQLDEHKCPHCPLNSDSHPHCPPALHLAKAVNRLGSIVSYADVNLRVVTAEREMMGKTSVQTVLSSIMGLLMATTGCPYTAYLRPMARFHLPLASFEETIFRSVSAYLVAQYLLGREGQPFDTSLGGLVKIYEDIQIVNVSFANRLKYSGEIIETNAITLLDMFAQSLPLAIDESLEEFRGLFQSYLE